MVENPKFTNADLFNFVNETGKLTYAGGGEEVQNPQRPDHHELAFSEPDWEYRDSYTGHFRSHGTELAKFRGQIVWGNSYRGGMVDGRDAMADMTFEFLKKAMSTDEEGFQSFRGPHELVDGDWRYEYQQEGDVNEFKGHEKIYFQGELIFYHEAIGGSIR